MFISRLPGRPLAKMKIKKRKREERRSQIHEMFRFSLACLVGVATAATYDHDYTLMKQRPAAFNVGGEVRLSTCLLAGYCRFPTPVALHPKKKRPSQILEMFRISLACLNDIATAATYDHDNTLMK